MNVLNFTSITILIIILILFFNLFGSFFNTNSNVKKIDLSNYDVATFAGGCFWCSESQFEKHVGVVEVISGFGGGVKLNPSYRDVSAGKTKYRESVQVYYDPKIISYNGILDIYWRHINPQDIGGQFVDRGFQYSPAIFYHNAEQKKLAQKSKENLIKSNKFENILVPIIKFTTFSPAEKYHQDYYKKNPIRYKFYRSNSGRDKFIEDNWN